MAQRNSIEKARQELQRLCYQGLDSWMLRDVALKHIRTVVPFDCAWWATTDPATLLSTSGLSDGMPEKSTPLFLANEILEEDVNKFSGLAQDSTPINTLHAATEGRYESSSRYREILRPFGMGDELRIALREGGLTWGFICMHRTLNAMPFSSAEMALLRDLGPHLAAGLRNALLIGHVGSGSGREPPGVITLSDDLSIDHMTANAQAWLEEMSGWPTGTVSTHVISSVASQLLAIERGRISSPLASPRVRIQTRAGRWLTLHALRLSNQGQTGKIAVVMEPTRPEEMAPLLLSAYALTERERSIAQYVLRGLSNKVIARAASVTSLTVQQHLKAIFEKVGVHSRGELIGRVMVDYHRQIAPEAGTQKMSAKSAVVKPAAPAATLRP